MRYRKIVIAGAGGFLGHVLSDYYARRTDEVILISRNSGDTKALSPGATPSIRTIRWDARNLGPWTEEIEGVDLLINLCGKNVNCRYNAKNREAILNSRIIPTELLGKAVSRAVDPPRLWINVTSATIYRHAEDRPQDEETGEIGEGFSAEVCKAWERAFFAEDGSAGRAVGRTRKIALRTGIVFGARDGVFPRLKGLVRWGLGGRQGSGRQYVSWIHEIDFARITEWLMEHTEISGVVNATAPSPLSNKDQMHLIRNGRPGLPAPAWLLEMGAWLIGTETELILKSRWVLPQRLEASGFRFLYPTLDKALEAIKASAPSPPRSPSTREV